LTISAEPFLIYVSCSSTAAKVGMHLHYMKSRAGSVFASCAASEMSFNWELERHELTV
jgi:hypothetical protein